MGSAACAQLFDALATVATRPSPGQVDPPAPQAGALHAGATDHVSAAREWGCRKMMHSAVTILRTNASFSCAPGGFAHTEALATCLPYVPELPESATIIGRSALLLVEAAKMPWLLQVKGCGRHTKLRLISGSVTFLRSNPEPLIMPCLVDPHTAPHSLAFRCHDFTVNRVLAEGWSVGLDSEDGFYIRFTTPLGPHHRSNDEFPAVVYFKARAATMEGLTLMQDSDRTFYTHGFAGFIGSCWATTVYTYDA